MAQPRIPAQENKASKLLAVGVLAAGTTPTLTGDFPGETYRVLEHTQTHPPVNQHQNGLICLWVVGEVTKS